MTTLTIGHGNGHNHESLVAMVRRVDADSFSCLEAQRLLDQLERIDGHRVIEPGEGTNEPRQRARSTCIVTRNRWPNVGTFTRQVSERIDHAARIAPDRVLVGSFFEHPLAREVGAEGIAHFALHPDASIMGRAAGDPITREYVNAMESTRRWMIAAQRDRLAVVLTGDLQAHDRFAAPWGPRAMLAEPMGFRTRVVGIDWIMADDRLRFAGPLKLNKLFDHRGFTASLKAAK